MDNMATVNKSLVVEEDAFVASDFYAVIIGGDGFSVENHGQIAGTTYGIITQMNSSTHEGTIENSGQIVGGTTGIIFNSNDLGTIHLSNTGLIWGGNFSVRSSGGTVYDITNRGEMRGTVALGGQADAFDNIGGIVRNSILMGGGNDVLRLGTGVEVADGGLDIDLLDFTGSGTVRVSLTSAASNTGAAAGDTYTGFENITGSLNGSDRLEGDAVANTLKGLGGNDSLFGMDGADSLEGGAGNDRMEGGTGADTMLGGAGNDTYVIDVGTDRVHETTSAVSTVDAGGTDKVFSTVGHTLGNFVENLTLTGAANINGSGNGLRNVLVGNGGNNTLNGLLGNDTMTGGAGVDRFVFNSALSATNIDRITDFAAGTDEIRLENAVFAGLAGGTLADTRFVANASGAATNTNHRVIYETDTGKLFFDADGSGAGAAIQFAVLQPGLALTNSDFFVI